MASKVRDNASDEIIDKNCSVCAGKNVTREAENYCVECQDYFCILCAESHKTFPAMRGHKLLDKADFSTHRLRSSLPCIPTERCQIHKTKVLDMFCKDHDEVVCSTCVAINHRFCKSLHSIPDEIDNLYNQPASDQTKKHLFAETNAAKDIKKEKQHLLQEIKNQRKTAITSIIDYRKKLETELKKFEFESIKQVDEKYNSLEKDLQSEIKETEIRTDELEQFTNKLQKSNGNKAQEFVSIKTAQKTILTASHSRSSLKTTARVEIHFSANTEVKNYLQQLNEIGIAYLSIQHASLKPRTTAYNTKQYKDIDIKLSTDNKTCYIIDSCFEEDGYCLLADCDNKNLKRLELSSETIIDHLDLEAAPIAVCVISKQEAAVRLNNRTLQFVSLGNQMTTTRKLKTNHPCYGLAYNDGKLYISDNVSSVYIHDLNGTLLHTITADKSGKPIFSCSRNISLSTDRDCVYVVDKNKGVITLDLLGNYLSTFTDTDLVDPEGVCTDGRGNLFVCGSRSSNIIQISETSKTKLCTIKTTPGPYTNNLLAILTNSTPNSVSYIPNQNKLVTTYMFRNSVTVYELF